MYISVIIDLKSHHVDQLYDYFVPEEFQSSIFVGTRVLVSFGNMTRIAYVIEIKDDSDKAEKPILDVIDPTPLLNDEQMQIYDYLSTNTTSLKSGILETILPSEYIKDYETAAIQIKKINDPLDKKFNRDGYWFLKKEDHRYYNKLKKLEKDGYIKLTTLIKDRIKPKLVRVYYFNHNHNYKKANNYPEVLNYFAENSLIKRADLLKIISTSSINTLLKHEVIQYQDLPLKHLSNNQFDKVSNNIILNKGQTKALTELKSGLSTNNEYLLYGVTGSGKTEVYVNLVEEVNKQGKTALILVPEINMIAQVENRLKSQFSNIAIIHSALTTRERFEQYEKIYAGRANIILGTRSSIFVPINNLGVIIMDEEQDQSYIQMEQSVYDTQQIALLRSNYHLAPIVYVSATPKIETMYKALNGEIKLLELTEKAVEKSRPSLKFVNLKEELKEGNPSILSNTLVKEIDKTLTKDEQVIVLVNRKGYSPFVMCRTCGYVPKCPSCNISLTYYEKDKKLKCHYCGYQEDSSDKCSNCHNHTLTPRGIGVEYVIKELEKKFPKANILQMDQTTTTRKGSHEKLWYQFLKKDADILVGTQMVAKAFDFPEVTLVAVIMADHDLKLQAYNADEKTYILLEQLIGRSGRHKPGTAVIQGYNLDHYAIDSLNYNYDYFYNKAIEQRKLGNYPPFVKMGQIIGYGPGFLKTYQDIYLLKEKMTKVGYNVLGPTEAMIFKRSDNYRFKLTIKYHQKDIENIIKMAKEEQTDNTRFTYTPFIDLE